MKKYINTLCLFIALATVAIGCDQINKPYLEDGGNNPIDTNYDKKILLEDYTGFKCGNCPKAHSEANRLHEVYGKNVIIVAVHASAFADTNYRTKFTYYFKTPTGTEWDNTFGLSPIGLPKGMVNRLGYKETSHILSYSSWSSKVEEALSNKAIVKLELNATLNKANGIIDIDVDYNYTSALTKYHNLNVIIVEDSIVNMQKWYGHTPEDVEDYVHNHVLRASVNNTWGDVLTEQKGNKKFSYNISGKDWRPEKLKVIAFISDVGNTYEVFQAEETELK